MSPSLQLGACRAAPPPPESSSLVQPWRRSEYKQTTFVLGFSPHPREHWATGEEAEAAAEGVGEGRRVAAAAVVKAPGAGNQRGWVSEFLVPPSGALKRGCPPPSLQPLPLPEEHSQRAGAETCRHRGPHCRDFWFRTKQIKKYAKIMFIKRPCSSS